ncbi:MAG: hypothetical protein E7243_05990 [Lacrimispora celerecrescens]|uniref:hypothetical protein n=1 Tax=Lacrimispora indolis TaxID=69825 RepID=UPI0004628307|nr:hypothetical protein [[Clostridium] methoxybenzovorans]MBE7719053.1 hypothetical protein [Lacrimispora celerecrescens]
MRSYLSIGIFFAGIILAVYIGYWTLFIKPIMVCVSAADAGMLTAAMTTMTIIKCALSWLVAGVIFGLGYIAAMIVSHR